MINPRIEVLMNPAEVPEGTLGVSGVVVLSAGTLIDPSDLTSVDFYFREHHWNKPYKVCKKFL